MKKMTIFIIILFTFLDQVIKYMVSTTNINSVVIPNFLSLSYAQNDGVAFSMLSGSRIFIIILSIILIFVLTNIVKNDYKKNKDKNMLLLSYGLLLSGILGNLIDRIIRGVVVDYISIRIFNYQYPIFNFADMLITVGIIIFIIVSCTNSKKEKK